MRKNQIQKRVSFPQIPSTSSQDRGIFSRTDVNVSPLVKIFQTALEATEDALGNTCQECRIVVLSRRTGECLQGLKNRHQQRPKANRPKTRRNGSDERIAHSLRTESRLVGCNPLKRNEKMGRRGSTTRRDTTRPPSISLPMK